MPIQVKKSSTWLGANKVWVRSGAIWNDSQVWVKKDGVWQFIQFELSLTISAHIIGSYNMYDAAVAAGWDGVSALDLTVTVNAGVYVGSTDPAIPSIRTGTGWPVGSTVRLVNNGFIYGRGGAPGLGGGPGGVGQPGGVGGLAFKADPGQLVTVENNGTMAGGGGGGGGGGGEQSYFEDLGGGESLFHPGVTGRNGGGGQGYDATSPADRNTNSPSPAGAGTAGGAGGLLGLSGSNGFTTSPVTGSKAGGFGGSPGDYAEGTGNITFTITGSRLGGSTP